MSDAPQVGSIAWTDLTVPNASEIRDFYEAVVGWTPEGLSMGDYEDFVMKDARELGVAGVCHARGENADLPSQWLIYIVVSDLDESIVACEARGGQVISGPRSQGPNRFAIIQDPSGAVAGLYQVGSE